MHPNVLNAVHKAPPLWTVLYLHMIVSIQQDVGGLQVQVEQRGVHAVQEVHSHSSLVDYAEAQLPGQQLGGQQVLQRPCLHVLHDEALRVLTDPIYGQDVPELGRLHLLGLLQQLRAVPVSKNGLILNSGPFVFDLKCINCRFVSYFWTSRVSNLQKTYCVHWSEIFGITFGPTQILEHNRILPHRQTVWIIIITSEGNLFLIPEFILNLWIIFFSFLKAWKTVQSCLESNGGVWRRGAQSVHRSFYQPADPADIPQQHLWRSCMTSPHISEPQVVSRKQPHNEDRTWVSWTGNNIRKK